MEKTYRSGELIDITVSSYSNIYGAEKLNYSLTYGIDYPLQKYIDELEKICLNDPTSDKTVKRRKRLDFLKKCNIYPSLQVYFIKMCNYLNGGNSTSQHPNKVILVVAGGNIITIFAHLLYEILHGVSTTTFQTLIDNRYSHQIQQDILNDMEILGYLEDFSTHPYSDFDFNIVVNKIDDADKVIVQMNHLTNEPNERSGFLLLRSKSREVAIVLKNQSNDLKKACKHLLPLDVFNQLYPQMVQQSFLERPELNDSNTHVSRTRSEIRKDKCRKYIQLILDKKEYINQLTKEGIHSTLSLFSEGELNPHISSRGQYATQPKYLIKPNGSSLESIIEYLHKSCETLNTYIHTWEQSRLSVSISSHGLVDYTKTNNMALVEKFKSLDTILQFKELLSLCSDVLLFYLNYPDFNISKILKKMNLHKDLSFQLAKPIVTIVPNKEHRDIYQHINDPIGIKFKAALKKKPSLPIGTSTTVNAIITDKTMDRWNYDNSIPEELPSGLPKKRSTRRASSRRASSRRASSNSRWGKGGGKKKTRRRRLRRFL